MFCLNGKILLGDIMLNAHFIRTPEDYGYNCALFKKEFAVKGKVKSAILRATARGLYSATLNGLPVGDFVLAPGWTEYHKRIQVQTYDVTELIKEENTLVFSLARGWYFSLAGLPQIFDYDECSVIAELVITYLDGTKETVSTDESFAVAKSPLTYCTIYGGEDYDARIVPDYSASAVISSKDTQELLIPEEGEKITEQERLSVQKIIHTPAGETVLDFGQNMAGFLSFTVTAKEGEHITFSCAEVLDKDGNFYNKNYRKARSQLKYICKEGKQTYKTEHTFYGFRYIRLDEFPENALSSAEITAIVVHSDMKRTGFITTSDKMLSQLFNNIIWGQKSNYIDVPTDCPQRDERYGWLGDAQMFIKTGSYNFDVQKFFRKWLGDMVLNQHEDGGVPDIVPAINNYAGAAWGDAITICPWQIYLTYGDKEILKEMFEPAKKWIGYITNVTTTPYLWTGGKHFGDWLELGGEYGKFKGPTRDDIVASAFYAYSTEIVCKMGHVLNEDVSYYEDLYKNIVKKYKETFQNDLKTQTECVVTLHFNLCDEPEKIAKQLVDIIHKAGDCLQTGFVGTPYILHVLSRYGYDELAYKLLLRTEYPSWLYPVTKGATTIWEHWDGITVNGDMWPDTMNSFNHYAYGSVGDWMYERAAGINTVEEYPGFSCVHFAPAATDKIDSFSATIKTHYGDITSGWYHKDGKVVYEIKTPVIATALIEGKAYNLTPGEYTF